MAAPRQLASLEPNGAEAHAGSGGPQPQAERGGSPAPKQADFFNAGRDQRTEDLAVMRKLSGDALKNAPEIAARVEPNVKPRIWAVARGFHRGLQAPTK